MPSARIRCVVARKMDLLVRTENILHFSADFLLNKFSSIFSTLFCLHTFTFATLHHEVLYPWWFQWESPRVVGEIHAAATHRSVWWKICSLGSPRTKRYAGTFFPHGSFIPSCFRRRSTELAKIQRLYALDWLHFMDGRSAGTWHLESDQTVAAVGPENDHQIPSRILPQYAGFPGSGQSRELTRRFLPTTERERRLWPIFQFFQKFSKKFSKIFQNFPKIFCIIS